MFLFINKNTMIISRCKPIEVSRRRFSEFIKNHDPENMKFVGWKYNEDGVKMNVQLDYSHIKDDITAFIEEKHGLGEPDGRSEVRFFQLTDDNFDEETQTHIIDLGKKKGCVEINGGANYQDATIYFVNPQVGGVTNIVVDNTGLPTEEDKNVAYEPVDDFHLYYGIKTSENNYEVLTVPVWCRGVVQILHLSSNDIVINSTYTDALEEYIPDVEVVNEDISNHPIDATPTEDDQHLDVNLQNESGYVEYKTGKYKEYTFWFENPEIGQVSYLVVDNTTGFQEVDVFYAKRVSNPDGTVGSLVSEVTNVSVGEKVVIEIFHSLSVDIVSKITKV